MTSKKTAPHLSSAQIIPFVEQFRYKSSCEDLETARINACEIISEISAESSLKPFLDRFLEPQSKPDEQDLSYAQNTLKNLAKDLKQLKNDITPQQSVTHHLLNGTQFTTRDPKSLYQLKPIRTKLTWQTGEHPVFRSAARHYNHAVQNFKNKRKFARRLKIASLIEPANNQPIIYNTPENIWPLSGQVYITTLQILFRINKNDSLSIPFAMIKKINIYHNALEIDYFNTHGNRVDIFLIEPDSLRLAEIILQSII